MKIDKGLSSKGLSSWKIVQEGNHNKQHLGQAKMRVEWSESKDNKN